MLLRPNISHYICQQLLRSVDISLPMWTLDMLLGRQPSAHANTNNIRAIPAMTRSPKQIWKIVKVCTESRRELPHAPLLDSRMLALHFHRLILSRDYLTLILKCAFAARNSHNTTLSQYLTPDLWTFLECIHYTKCFWSKWHNKNFIAVLLV